MENLEEILKKERARVIEIIETKTIKIIEQREAMTNWRSKHTISLSGFQRLQDDIIFLIDNPDYVSIKGEVEQDER